MSYKITLADGTSLNNLSMNGNNYISETDVTEEVLSDSNLKKVVFYNGQKSWTLTNLKLVHISKYADGIYFSLTSKNTYELDHDAIYAKIEDVRSSIGDETITLHVLDVGEIST